MIAGQFIMLKIVCVLLTAVTISACTTHQRPIENTRQRYYIVQPDDNFYSIAFTLEITAEQLRRANPWLNPLNISPGMRLSLPRYLPDSNSVGDNRAHPENQFGNDDRASVRVLPPTFIWPLSRVEVSSHYGYRRGNLHTGIDLRGPRGTRIYASAAGRVIFSGRKRGYGLIIVIDHGRGLETAYAHNDRNIAKQGQQVKQGQVVATVGRSGNATGYHVHFEIREHGKAINPTRHLAAAL